MLFEGTNLVMICYGRKIKPIQFHLEFLKKFYWIQLIYNVVLVSGIQQSESVIHVFTLFLDFLYRHYRVLSRVP